MGSRGRTPSAPVIDDDEDDGFSSAKWVPASQRANSSKQELEDEMTQRNRELTDKTLGLKRLTEQTKGVAGQTLVTLKEQGEQIDRIHGTTVKVDQELQKGEKLLGKLGGISPFSWMPTTRRGITGPEPCGRDQVKPASKADREALGTGRPRDGAPDTQGMSAMDRCQAERKFQDDVLDDVSNNLEDIKSMALAMGQELDCHDKKLERVGGAIAVLNDGLGNANKKANKLLGT